MLLTSFLFSDPLGFHILTFSHFAPAIINFISAPKHTLNINYKNSTYRLNWGLRYTLNILSVYLSDVNKSEVTNKTHIVDHFARFNMHYPVFQKGRWRLIAFSENKLSFYDHFKILFPVSEFSHSWRGITSLSYSKKHHFNYDSSKYFSLGLFLDHSHLFHHKRGGLKPGAYINQTYHLGKGFYLYPGASSAFSLNPAINPVTLNTYKSNTLGDSKNERELKSDTGGDHLARQDIGSVFLKSNIHAKSIHTLSLGF